MLNLDTPVLLYALTGRLKKKEREALSQDRWSISSIVLWEITQLAQLGRIGIDLEDSEVLRVLSRIPTWPIDLNVCRATPELDFASGPAGESSRPRASSTASRS